MNSLAGHAALCYILCPDFCAPSLYLPALTFPSHSEMMIPLIFWMRKRMRWTSQVLSNAVSKAQFCLTMRTLSAVEEIVD
jgi:hypothetical protein